MRSATHDTLPLVRSDPAPPVQVDVVVVGGGIVGASTSLFLAQKGLSVALVEKGEVAGEQSSRNWGWCRTIGRETCELPLSVESLRLWRDMDRLTEAESGFRQAGIIYACDTQAELDAQEAWLDRAREYQLDARIVRGNTLADVLPGAARAFVGGLLTPSDGRAEPRQAAVAIAEAARRKGAAVLTSCAVRGIETKAGRIAAAVTERGTVGCQSVVLAGGAWSRLFCGNLGIDLPQLKVLGSVIRTKPLDGLPEVAVGGTDFAFRKRFDGGYTVARRGANITHLVPDSFRLFADFLPAYRKNWRDLRLRVGTRFIKEWQVPRHWALDRISPFERVRVLDPQPADSILAEAKRNLAAAFPAFSRMEEAERWGGLIDVTPDAVPVISPVEALPGFFIATGFSGHGFGIGPGAGRLMADLVAGDAPIVDPRPFRYQRFDRTGGRPPSQH